MNAYNNSRLEIKLRQIESVSGALRGVCTILLALVGIAVVFGAVAAASGRLTTITYFSRSISIADTAPHTSATLAVVVGLTGLVIGKAIYHLRRLLDNYSRGEVFTTGSARQIRYLGISCILWGVMKIIWAFLPRIVLVHPPASVDITFDSLAIGVVIVAISWFAEMAAALREENDLTI